MVVEKLRIFQQEETIALFEGHVFQKEWLQVSGHYNINEGNAGVWCGFVSLDHIEDIYRDYGWDISSDGGFPGFEISNGETKYRSSLLNDGFEALIYYRDFYGVKSDYVELSQEFILLNNLRYDRKERTYYAMYEDGNSEKAVKYEDDCKVSIKTKFIRKYAAAKQMAFLYFFDVRTKFSGTLEENKFTVKARQNKTDSSYWMLSSGNLDFSHECFSRLLGKSVLYPQNVEKCGYWPYEEKREYLSFIIGTDKDGNAVKFTSDPNKLNNYFNANSDAPMYLTPVFFKREVLRKYYERPELYTITDGHLECQNLWAMELDNHSNDYVSAYLGDLGRDLPESEQMHWKSYNVQAERKISDVSLKRDFFNMFAESGYIEHVLKRDYTTLCKRWNGCYGWDLYSPLPEEDKYLLKQIHIPLTDSQSEFDQLVLALDKIVIEALNKGFPIILTIF